MHRRAFTLIELLVVIAIIAILSVVVILTLNPSQLLQQSRDSNRISDMATLNTAIGVYAAGGGTSFGSSSVIYVSIADPTATSTAGDQCQGLGLPTLPSTYSYHCAASSTLRSTDATGWIPINFSSVALGSALGSLPIDPINQSSSRLYYTYTTNGTQYEVTSAMESAKYKLGGSNDVIGTDGSTLSTVYAKGSNLALEPLDYGDSSLVGLWSFNEGTGTIAYDYSGNGNNGIWNGGSSYTTGIVGTGAGSFFQTNSVKATTTQSLQPTTAITFSSWVKTSVYIQYSNIEANFYNQFPNTGYGTYVNGTSTNGYSYCSNVTVGGAPQYICVVTSNGTSNWNMLTTTFDGSNIRMYVNGVYQSIQPVSGLITQTSTNPFVIGGQTNALQGMGGLVDDVRVYNRVLSASEIAAMYAGGK